MSSYYHFTAAEHENRDTCALCGQLPGIGELVRELDGEPGFVAHEDCDEKQREEMEEAIAEGVLR